MAADGGAGQIRWDQWETGVRISHFDQSCLACGASGPLQVRGGRQLQPGRRVRKLTRRSDVVAGVRPQARTVWVPGSWVLTHVAFRCLRCAEEVTYRYASGSAWLVEVPELCRPGRAVGVVVDFPGRDG